jgi:hypothetical protein
MGQTLEKHFGKIETLRERERLKLIAIAHEHSDFFSASFTNFFFLQRRSKILWT